jgi:hypothetical protein
MSSADDRGRAQTGGPLRRWVNDSGSSDAQEDYAITMRYPPSQGGRMRRMTTQKVSVTLGTTAIERARQAAGPRGLSSYVDAALEEKLDRDERRRAFLDYLKELEAADPTPEEVKNRANRRASRIRQAASQ